MNYLYKLVTLSQIHGHYQWHIAHGRTTNDMGIPSVGFPYPFFSIFFCDMLCDTRSGPSKSLRISPIKNKQTWYYISKTRSPIMTYNTWTCYKWHGDTIQKKCGLNYWQWHSPGDHLCPRSSPHKVEPLYRQHELPLYWISKTRSPMVIYNTWTCSQWHGYTIFETPVSILVIIEK